MTEIHISTGSMTFTDFVIAFATSGLLIGAIVTAIRVGQQTNQMREQHRDEMRLMREQHADEMLTARRPVLTVSEFLFDGKYLSGTIRNPGPGLAVSVMVEAWLTTVEDPHLIGWDALQQQLRSLELHKTPRQFHAAPGALGSGDRAERFTFNAEFPFELQKSTKDQVFAVWRSHCSDVTGEPQAVVMGVTLVRLETEDRDGTPSV